MEDHLDDVGGGPASDAEFLRWAGVHPERWALLPGERRESWLEHLVARMRTTADPEQRRSYWRLATAIARADDAAFATAED